ncbi:MAG: S1C family serine protease [Fusicatenibacter sp.]|nr:S1C family serine protease [Lachnospiraceae bacterium]MDY2938706.1 S1C family serine protease [Fusicatenibacter sp.]
MENDPKNYKFMKEIIKKEPPDIKKMVIRFALLLFFAVIFGAVAAVTFAVVEPLASNAFAAEEKPPKVDIPSDEDPDDVNSNETESASSSLTDSENTTSGSEVSSEEIGKGSEATSSDGEGQTEQKEISLEDYEKIYHDMLEVAAKPQRALVTVIGITSQMDYFNQNYESQQQISGLIVAENGQDLFILTEYRIVENIERIQVTFWDSTMVDAIYQKHDPNTGLTILKVEEEKLGESTREGLEIAPLGNSYSVNQGDPILALGSPIGYSDSVAYGIVTSVTNKISTLDTEYNLLTTDILGSADGSGILVNLDGEIVGIIAQSYGSTKGKNVVTGIAISQIKQLIEALSNNVSRSYIGIKGQNVTDEISDKTGIPKGVLVTGIAEESPAMMAGIKEYDVIVKVDGEKTLTLKQYHDQLVKHSPGTVVKVIAMRKGAEGYAEMEFEVTIGEI